MARGFCRGQVWISSCEGEMREDIVCCEYKLEGNFGIEEETDA